MSHVHLPALPLRAERETSLGRDQLLKILVENCEQQVGPPRSALRLAQNPPSFAPPVRRAGPQNKLLSQHARGKIERFCTAHRDFRRRCKTQHAAEQHLTTIVPKTADAKPFRFRGLQHYACHHSKPDVQNPAPSPQSPTPIPRCYNAG
jgi:hypothetical protein